MPKSKIWIYYDAEAQKKYEQRFEYIQLKIKEEITHY